MKQAEFKPAIQVQWRIVIRMRITMDGVLNWILDLLTTYTHDSELQAITALPLISTVHKSQQLPLSPLQPVVSSPAVSW
jgi:hypothetical protein